MKNKYLDVDGLYEPFVDSIRSYLGTELILTQEYIDELFFEFASRVTRKQLFEKEIGYQRKRGDKI